jgi:hypothetical protein
VRLRLLVMAAASVVAQPTKVIPGEMKVVTVTVEAIDTAARRFQHCDGQGHER